jgi:phosphoglycerate dehydrogenase-like enzyme
MRCAAWAKARRISAVSSCIGKKLSIRSSCKVTSWGVPSVAIVVNSSSEMALTAEMGRAAARLKLVQVPGAGLDRIDGSALPPGAMLANAYGHEAGIAEYVIGAILALTREFVRLDRALRHGDWQSQWAIGAAPPPVWSELAGKTVGILGYGRIGQAIAGRARTFGMEICAIRRDVGQSAGDNLTLLGGPDTVDEVLRRSDYVVISLPATPETIGWIGRKELGLMKPGAFLINVARAEIVDEDALYEALSRRSIAGAALDVWYRYRSPRLSRSLVFCLEFVITTWRYDRSGKIISLDAPGHLHKSPPQAGRGFKNPIFINLTA